MRHLQFLVGDAHLLIERSEGCFAHLVIPQQRLQQQHVTAHPECCQPRLLAQSEMHDRRARRVLERASQQRIRLDRFRCRLEKVAAAEHNRVELVARHELDHIDLSALFFGQRCEVVIRQNHGAVAVVIGLVDVGVVDDFAADFALALIPDAPAIRVVHLMERDVMVFGGAVDPDRNVDEAEGDGTGPNCSHAPIASATASCR